MVYLSDHWSYFFKGSDPIKASEKKNKNSPPQLSQKPSHMSSRLLSPENLDFPLLHLWHRNKLSCQCLSFRWKQPKLQTLAAEENQGETRKEAAGKCWGTLGNQVWGVYPCKYVYIICIYLYFFVVGLMYQSYIIKCHITQLYKKKLLLRPTSHANWCALFRHGGQGQSRSNKWGSMLQSIVEAKWTWQPLGPLLKVKHFVGYM